MPLPSKIYNNLQQREHERQLDSLEIIKALRPSAVNLYHYSQKVIIFFNGTFLAY